MRLLLAFPIPRVRPGAEVKSSRPDGRAPPWQRMQYSAKNGFTCLSKSIEAATTTGAGVAATVTGGGVETTGAGVAGAGAAATGVVAGADEEVEEELVAQAPRARAKAAKLRGERRLRPANLKTTDRAGDVVIIKVGRLTDVTLAKHYREKSPNFGGSTAPNHPSVRPNPAFSSSNKVQIPRFARGRGFC